MDQAPPSFVPDHCLNRRQTRHPCTLCHERCPVQAIPLNPVIEKIDWNTCIRCGLCVSACPSRCFAPEIRQQQIMTAPEKSDRVTFVCAHTKEPVDGRRVECLCGLPWEWLAALAIRMPVVLYTGECDRCALTNCAAQLLENLQMLRAFLGETRFDSQIILTDDASDLKQREEKRAVDRRAFFSMLGNRAKTSVAAGVSSVLPAPKDDPHKDGFAYRKMLAGMIRKDCVERHNESKKENRPARFPEYGVMLPEFGAKCHGCGVCVRVCPHKALSIETETEKTSVISIEPMKCTACGLCEAVCLHKGIEGMALTPVHHLENQGYVRVHHESCSKCGAAIARDAEDGMCIACAAKKRGRRSK